MEHLAERLGEIPSLDLIRRTARTMLRAGQKDLATLSTANSCPVPMTIRKRATASVSLHGQRKTRGGPPMLRRSGPGWRTGQVQQRPRLGRRDSSPPKRRWLRSRPRSVCTGRIAQSGRRRQYIAELLETKSYVRAIRESQAALAPSRPTGAWGCSSRKRSSAPATWQGHGAV
jgi:hypothetical protein